MHPYCHRRDTHLSSTVTALMGLLNRTICVVGCRPRLIIAITQRPLVRGEDGANGGMG